jgi:hypothetical protein
MAKKFLTAIDLNKNELQNASIQNLASAPASPVAGQIYFNTTDKLFYVYDGTAWDKFTPSGSIANDDIASNAAIALSKLASDPLARANHTGTQAASTISDLATTVQAYRLDQFAAPTSSLALNSQKITGLADPTSAQDAATKAYVDAVKTGLDVKDSVRVATTANITLSGTQTIDDVAVIAGNRVLVKDQSTGSQNGIYVVAAGAWSRSTDADASSEVTGGMFTFVSEGTVNADSGWVLSTNDSITLGTTALTFVQFSGAGQVTAGAGLTKTGTTLDVVGTANRITVNPDSIDISSSYIGQNTITTLGTIATGVWNGTTISVANGGSGATTLTGYLKGNGTSAFTAVASIPGSDVSGNISGTASNVSGTVAIANGGTGATTAGAALTALGASPLAGSSSIVTVGTISSGTWNATTIATNKGGTGLTSFTNGGAVYATSTSALTTGTLPLTAGGTGATTATGARTNIGATGKYSAKNASITPSSGIATWSIPAATHLVAATGAIVVQMKEVSGLVVEADVSINDTNGDVTITWNASTTVAADTYRVTIIG